VVVAMLGARSAARLAALRRRGASGHPLPRGRRERLAEPVVAEAEPALIGDPANAAY
jgi:hypothetical protein